MTTPPTTPRDHWQGIYSTKPDAELSWTQPDPALSLELIQQASPTGRVLDVGGGASPLAGRLLDLGYNVAVLDIAEAALTRAKQSLGPRAEQVRWINADITADTTGAPPFGEFDIWHDRAVFHFLTNPHDRERYLTLLTATILPRGHAIIAIFAHDGPQQCSGLPVQRYAPEQLAAELGMAFTPIRSERERHLTPWGKEQWFQHTLFQRL